MDFHAAQKCAGLEIDATQKLWRVKNAQADAFGHKKSGLLGKSVLAAATGGISVMVAAGKAIAKAVTSDSEHAFSDLLGYELLEDDTTVVSGGLGRAIVGSTFGNTGAIVGAVTGKKVQKKIVHLLTVKLTVNDLQQPCIMIPLITKPTKTTSKEYQEAYNTAQQLLALLSVITAQA